jgi:alpha-L-fucosidase
MAFACLRRPPDATVAAVAIGTLTGKDSDVAVADEAIREGSRQRAEARTDPRLQWFRDAKFGLFIHWGLYAVPAGEWKGQPIAGIGEWIMKRATIPVAEYEQLAKQFNPVKFNAAEWVAMAKAAGQKYIVITSKHHDGFAMYHSKVSAYNIVDATPFKRDPLKELAAECQKQGIKLGFYHSQTQDWHHPNGDGNDWDYVEEQKDFDGYVEHYVKAQVRELLTGYGPICLIWFDTPKRMTLAQSHQLADLVHELQPDCLVSGRIGNAVGDYAEAGDNKIPSDAVGEDWETPATINDTWGFKTNDQNWKSTGDLLHKLVDIASKGGNYLLNVGPTAEGVIPAPSVERLRAMGAWLDINGESIYGTRPGPLQGLDWCRTTAKPGAVYLHVLKWPAGGKLTLPATVGQVRSAYLLSDQARTGLPVEQIAKGVTIAGPTIAPDAIDTVAVLEVAG